MAIANFTREELADIRWRAEQMATVSHMNPGWIRAFNRLADAADQLDAMLARSTVVKSPTDTPPVSPEIPDISNASDSGEDERRSQGCPHSGG